MEEGKKIISSWGIEKLYPPQEECIDDVLRGKNAVLAFPTASGKSLLAYLAIMKRVVEEGGKALYIVPLRSLASEKVEDLQKFKSIGLNVAVSMGDYDEPDPRLEQNDVIVATSEKADSLLRHNVGWLRDITLVVADEVHLINDRDRGATLEVTLSKLKQVNPEAQIIALSATIRNSDALAEWLDAEHHKSEWRPVELREGTYYHGKVIYADGSSTPVKDGDPVRELCRPTLEKGAQCLVFVSTRRSTESAARDMGDTVKEYLTHEEKERLQSIAEEILMRSTTSVGKKLAKYVEAGTAFHNAGLSNVQRKLVEKGFKSRDIKLIAATPTLAAGVNLPARRVIIRDCKRYDPLHGFYNPIPVMEIKQMCGRAGRPGYDDKGEAILVAKSERAVEFMKENYLLGESEVIHSRMAVETSLRKHLLALVATSHCKTKEDVMEFMEGTFHAHYSDLWTIEGLIDQLFDTLEEHEMIEYLDDRILPTKFGRLVSSLYIDPFSAITLKEAASSGRKGIPLSYLHSVCLTPDIYQLYIKKKELSELEARLSEVRADLFFDVPHDQGEMEHYYSAFKTALMLKDWMEEVSEDDISKGYDIGPGDIRNRVETAEWLLHSSARISSLYNPNKVERLKTLTIRVKNGVREELLPLMKLRQIGRVRARTLFEAGYHRPEDVLSATAGELSKLPGIGDKLASRVSDLSEQVSLLDF
ncbi:MAG: DEAD/DEAH box helicase [Thermoplasmata archaeon]